MFYNYRAIIHFYNRNKISSRNAFTISFVSLLCTNALLACLMKTVLNIIYSCRKLILILNNFATISVSSQDDKQIFQAHRAS